jgi:hypothetical protein
MNHENEPNDEIPKTQSAELDRRTFPRVDSHCPIDFRVVDNAGSESDSDDFVSATAKNISIDGLCIMSSDPVEPRRLIEIELYLPDTAGPVPCTGKVAWCRQGSSEEPGEPDSDEFHIGVELIWAGQGDEAAQVEINRYVRRALILGDDGPVEDADLDA